MYNKTVILGNLGQDPSLRYLPSGQAVANLSVACNRRWTDSNTGQSQEETVWFRVSVWGKQAEAVNQYLEKGRQVLVEGRLRPDPATGGPRIYARNDGSAGAAFELVAERVQFLGSNGAANGNADEPATNGQRPRVSANVQPAYEADEIPF